MQVALQRDLDMTLQESKFWVEHTARLRHFYMPIDQLDLVKVLSSSFQLTKDRHTMYFKPSIPECSRLSKRMHGSPKLSALQYSMPILATAPTSIDVWSPSNIEDLDPHNLCETFGSTEWSIGVHHHKRSLKQHENLATATQGVGALF